MMRVVNSESLAVLEIRNNQINLQLGKYLIGSGSDCDVVIDDSTVEQRHALLVVQQHCIKIIDFLTESGTYVDNENICNGGFNDILKSVSIKFGSVDAQIRLIEESDSGFLGLTSGDSLDIIPLSPQECTTARHNSEMGSSRIRSKGLSSQSEFRIPDVPSLNSSHADKLACNDGFLANVTDVNIRRAIEQMTEEDEYYIPETQEIFERRPQSPKDNTNEEVFRITTQEFKDDPEENIPLNEMSNTSLVIPLIRCSPILITDFNNQSPTISTSEQGTCSKKPSVEVDYKNYDTDAEISIKWNESTNNSAPAEDLDGLNSVEQIKEESLTPDLDLTHIRSGSTTPNLFEENETSPIMNIDVDEHLLSPTQIFPPKKSVVTNSTSFIQEPVPLNVSNTDSNRVVNQPLVESEKVNPSTTTNSPDLRKNDHFIFAKPLPIPPKATIDAHSLEYDDAVPTQPFVLQDRSKPSTSTDVNNDFDQFPPTQLFDRQTHRSVSPALNSSSDEEDAEFCLRKTLLVGEKEKILETPLRSSTSRGTSKNGSREEIQEDDIFDIQPTPRTDVIELPNVSLINNVENLFYKEKKNRRRRASSSADSSSEDDNAFIKKTKTIKHKKDIVKQKILSVRLKRDRKSDEAIKSQNLLLTAPKDVQKKNSLSDPSTSSDVKGPRGRPRKRLNSNEKKGDKEVKQAKMSTSSNVEKNAENEKKAGDAIRKQNARKKYTKNADNKSDKAKEEKEEVPQKKTQSKRIPKKVPLKVSPEKPTKITSEVGSSKSEFGDSPEEYHTNLGRRISRRIKSMPSHISEDYYTESDLKKKIGEKGTIEKQPEQTLKTSRRIPITKNIKQYPKKYSNLQSSSSDTSLDESDKRNKSNEAVLKNSTGKNLFYTSTPSVRNSSRLGRHHICFTRVDSSDYVDIIKKTGCKIEDDPKTSTVLVTAKICRTWKMLAAIARGLPIVSPDWFKILESNSNESYSYDDYLLQDPSGEQQYKFNLKKSLQAARKKPIFTGFTFFITPKTQPNPVEMTRIIGSGGGTVLNRYPRDIQNLTNFYIISTREDADLWKRYKNGASNVSIFSSEAIMSAIMQQCINFKRHQLL